LSRDKQLVYRIIACLKESNTFINQSGYTKSKQLSENSMVLRACTMCIIEVSELVYEMSDLNRSKIKIFRDLTLKKIRNRAAHSYGSINKEMLAALILSISSNKTIQKIEELAKEI